MHKGTKVNGAWIVDRLIAIRALERELTEALSSGNSACDPCLRSRVQQLKSWVDSLDRALEAHRAADALGVCPRRPRPALSSPERQRGEARR